MKAESSAPGSSTSISELAVGERWLARTLEDVDVGASPRQVLGRLDDRRVCLVVVAPGDDEEQWASFSAAAARRARLTGDRLLPVVASARSEGVFCVAYDIGESTPYAAHRETIEGSASFCLQLLWGIARALDQVAEAGFQPTELTPESVFIHGTRGAQLADLGVAREALGNPPSAEDRQAPWIAPEILQGEGAAERSAVYSFGALMYTMLTGAPPHSGRREQIAAAPPPSLRAVRPDLPEALDLVVSAAMAPDPRQRYRTASEARSVAQIVLQTELQSQKSSFLRGLRFKRSSTAPPPAATTAAPSSTPAPPEPAPPQTRAPGPPPTPSPAPPPTRAPAPLPTPSPAPPETRAPAPPPTRTPAPPETRAPATPPTHQPAPPPTRAPARPPAPAAPPPAPAAPDDDVLVQRERERAAQRKRDSDRAAKRERERAYRQKRANELAAKRDQDRVVRERRNAELAAERERERIAKALADAGVAAEREQEDLARAKSEADERAHRAAERERRRETREGRAERRRERRAASVQPLRERRTEPSPARQQSTVAAVPAPVVAQPAPRRPPRRALPLALIGVALALGAAGGVLLGGSSDSPAPSPQRLSTAGFGLTMPAGWEGSSPGRGRAEAHPADDARSGLTLALSDEPIERTEQANPVQLGRLEAWREPGVEVPGTRRAVRYVVPTETGKLVATCRASGAAPPDTLAQCERAASTLRLSSATGLPLAAVVEQQERWQAEVKRLDQARAGARRKLAGAERPAGQLLAAEALVRVHERGAERFGALPGGETVAAAARRTARAYGGLARAAGAPRSARWNAARQRVRRAEAALRQAIDSA